MTTRHVLLKSGAELSDDELYRYTLTRVLREPVERVAVFVMLNPSTADATADDPTIRRVRGFTEREGCDAFVVVNLSPYRATKPDALAHHREPGDVNARNSAAIRRAVELALDTGGPIVAAWGASLDRTDLRRLHTRRAMFGSIVRGVGAYASALGTTKSGQPRHPLMLAADTPLEPWPAVKPGDPPPPGHPAVASVASSLENGTPTTPEPATAPPPSALSEHPEGARLSQQTGDVVHRCQFAHLPTRCTPTSDSRSLFIHPDGRRACANHAPPPDHSRCTHALATAGRCPFCGSAA